MENRETLANKRKQLAKRARNAMMDFLVRNHGLDRNLSLSLSYFVSITHHTKTHNEVRNSADKLENEFRSMLFYMNLYETQTNKH